MVIDESHNFRNKRTPRQGGETRYDRLMRRIIRDGVKTRVLMLSATPVNNRLADLRNQIAFATQADDARPRRPRHRQYRRHHTARAEAVQPLARSRRRRAHPSAAHRDAGIRLLHAARSAHHRTLTAAHREVLRDGADRTVSRAAEADQPQAGRRPCGSVPFHSRDQLGKSAVSTWLPMRRCVTCCRTSGRRTTRSTAPSSNGARDFFRQVDREESLVQLLRVNALKRMESSVTSFALTVRRQLADVEGTLARLEDQARRAGRDRHRGSGHRRSGIRESAGWPQGQGPSSGRRPDPLETGSDRRSQSPRDAARGGVRGYRRRATPSSPSCAR